MTKEQKAKEIVSQILHESYSYEDWVRWISEGLEEYAAMKAQPLVDVLKVLRLGVPEGHEAEKAIEAALASYAGSAEEEKEEFGEWLERCCDPPTVKEPKKKDPWIPLSKNSEPLKPGQDYLLLFKNGDIKRRDEENLPFEIVTHYCLIPEPPAATNQEGGKK